MTEIETLQKARKTRDDARQAVLEWMRLEGEAGQCVQGAEMSASEWWDIVMFGGLMMVLVNFVYWRGQVSMLNQCREMLNHWSLK